MNKFEFLLRLQSLIEEFEDEADDLDLSRDRSGGGITAIVVFANSQRAFEVDSTNGARYKGVLEAVEYGYDEDAES